MKLKEEKELQSISEEYEKALHLFLKKSYAKAGEIFARIVESYKDSEFYSVLEIQTRAKVYQSITHAQTHPLKIKLENAQDHIWEGAFQLNAGDVAKALEHFAYAEKSNCRDAYLYYLMAAAYLRQEDTAGALRYIEKCLKKDESYKVIIYNEPDFEPLQQNPDFLKLVE
jgi:tetratricopeptide (TPR) repeat protein